MAETHTTTQTRPWAAPLVAAMLMISILALSGTPVAADTGDAPAMARISPIDAAPSPSPSLGDSSCPNEGKVLIHQPPNQLNGFFSDANCSACNSGAQSIADNFILAEPATVAQIVLWGGYFPLNEIPPAPDPFTVIFHENATGPLPGSVIDTQTVVPTSATLTGTVLFGVDEVLYVVDIEPVDLPAGTLWVEIFTDSVDTSDQFFWEAGNLDAENGILNNAFSLSAPGTGWITGNPVSDMAMTLCGENYRPSALEIASVENGVFEPGEAAVIAPEWENLAVVPRALLGDVSNFTGPAGPIYTAVDIMADYGTVPAGEPGSCTDMANCYVMSVTPSSARPALHWDGTFDESINMGVAAHTWTLHIGESFEDVANTSPFYPYIETLLHAGVTSGCSSTEFCVGATTTRSQMPVFVLKAAEGAGFVPPACVIDSEMFADVPASSSFCPWIEELANRGVVAGCGGDNYCPGDLVTRAQMSVFLLRTLLGSGYTPPTCSGIFTDVTCPSLFADWIEDLFSRGVTSGCSATEFCPAADVSRSGMAVFLAKTFALSLYGP